MFKLLACLGLALGLAGCAGSDVGSLLPASYQPTGESGWHKDCKKDPCRIILHGQYGTSVYAGYHSETLVIGFETPPGSGVPYLVVNGYEQMPTADLGCDRVCQAYWLLSPQQQRQLLSARTLAFKDSLWDKKEVALSPSNLAEALDLLR